MSLSVKSLGFIHVAAGVGISVCSLADAPPRCLNTFEGKAQTARKQGNNQALLIWPRSQACPSVTSPSSDVLRSPTGRPHDPRACCVLLRPSPLSGISILLPPRLLSFWVCRFRELTYTCKAVPTPAHPSPQWFSAGVILLPGGHLGTSGGTLGCHHCYWHPARPQMLPDIPYGPGHPHNEGKRRRQVSTRAREPVPPQATQVASPFP